MNALDLSNSASYRLCLRNQVEDDRLLLKQWFAER